MALLIVKVIFFSRKSCDTQKESFDDWFLCMMRLNLAVVCLEKAAIAYFEKLHLNYVLKYSEAFVVKPTVLTEEFTGARK